MTPKSDSDQQHQLFCGMDCLPDQLDLFETDGPPRDEDVTQTPEGRKMRTDFEERRHARIERLERRAETARQRSQDHYQASNAAIEHIPFGQPILVGHHSEKRHRAALNRADGQMRKSCEEAAKAKHYEEKAEAAARNRAISSDDPEALEKLREKLAGLRTAHAHVKQANAILRKAKLTPEDPDLFAKLTALDLPERDVSELCKLARLVPFQCRPYVRHPAYVLTNNNANMKRVEGRIKELEARAERVATEPIEAEGFTISEDTDWGRVLIEFDRKPPKAVCKWLRSFGWRWAPSRTAWVRQLNGSGQAMASLAAEQLPKMLT